MDFIGAFIQANVKHRVFLNFDSRYEDYLPEYFSYFVIPLRPKKSMYGMTNNGKLFANDITNWLMDEAVFKNHNQKCPYTKSMQHMDPI